MDCDRELGFKISNGIIIQWGTVIMSNTTYIDLTFPVAFTTTAYKIICMDKNQALTTSSNIFPIFAEATSFATTTQTRIICTENDIQAVSWIAIGY